MDIDTQIDEPVEESVRDSLMAAFEEHAPDPVVAEKTTTEKPVETKTRDESGKFAKPGEKTPDPLIADKIPDAPRSWTAAEKAEWATMTPNQRAAVARR